MTLRWQIITGEYPPQPGGVGDYTRLLAHGLAQAGDEVDVWTSPLASPAAGAEDPVVSRGVTVHRLPDRFGRRSLEVLGAALDRCPGSRVLIQYEPWSFGGHAMNVPFCYWLWGRRKRPSIIMFHEVAVPWGGLRRPKWNVLWATNRLMALLAVQSATRVFVSIGNWEELLRPMAGRAKRIDWLPVFSNIPRDTSPAAAGELRSLLLERAGVPQGRLVGHFSTFHGEIARMMREILPLVLEKATDAAVLLLGRHGEEFTAAFAAVHPELASRVIATGNLEPGALARHLAACELLVEPYPDGVSSRRGTTMAGLALGLPIVTNLGACSDAIWSSAAGLRVAVEPSSSLLSDAVLELLASPAECERLAREAANLYDTRFDIAHTIHALRSVEMG